MSPDASNTGYIPTFCMPIIAPPIDTTDPATYYTNVAAQIDFQVDPSDSNCLSISFNNPADTTLSKLYSVAGGLMMYVPPGNPLPDPFSEPLPDKGSLVQKVWAVDVDKMSNSLVPGNIPYTVVYYLNVDQATVKVAMKLVLDNWPDIWLDVVPGNGTEPVHATKVLNYIDAFMLGNAGIFVDGGTYIGDAGQAIPTDITSPREIKVCIAGAGIPTLPQVLVNSILKNTSIEQAAGLSSHPIVTAQGDTQINIYAKFEIYDPEYHVHVAIEGLNVDLIDDSTGNAAKVDTATTNNEGIVHFTFSNLQEINPISPPNIFFNALTNGRTINTFLLDKDWSTKGWTGTVHKITGPEDCSGYYEDFSDPNLGTAFAPLTFRIGVDFHAKFQYWDQNRNVDSDVPKGILIEFQGSETGVVASLRTNDKGCIDGWCSNIIPDESVSYNVVFKIYDNDINLQEAFVANIAFVADSWDTCRSDKKNVHRPNNRRSSLGSNNDPDIFCCAAEERNTALYLLKIWRELSTFLYLITDGDWEGIENLGLHRWVPTPKENVAGSWPPRSVWIDSDLCWDRFLILHELGHQIMWQAVDIFSIDLLYYYIEHNYYNLFNTYHALLEGWADFIAGIFVRSSPSFGFPYRLQTATNSNGHAVLNGHGPDQVPSELGMPPFDCRGESIEGAFTMALFNIFQNLIVTHQISPNAGIPESENGDITIDSPWLSNHDIHDRFIKFIWEPLKNLVGKHIDTSNMLINIYENNPDIWHKMLFYLQAWNICVQPFEGAIDPAEGKSDGGTSITILGAGFAEGTSILIDGNAAQNIIIASSGKISATTPPANPNKIGQVPVKIQAPNSQAIEIYNGFRYIQE